MRGPTEVQTPDLEPTSRYKNGPDSPGPATISQFDLYRVLEVFFAPERVKERRERVEHEYFELMGGTGRMPSRRRRVTAKVTPLTNLS